MRSLITFIAFLATAFSVAQLPDDPKLDQKVSLDIRADRPDVVVSKIGVAVGMTLKASPSLAREIVLVSVSDVSARDLLGRLADAVCGTWKDVNGVMTLVRDPVALNARTRDDLAIRLAAIKEDLDRRKKSLAKPFTEASGPDQAAAQMEMKGEPDAPTAAPAWRGPDPDQRFMDRLVMSLKPEDLAGLRPGQRLVYSSNPTRAQRALPGAGAAVAALQKELNLAHFEMPRDTVPGRVLLKATRNKEQFDGSGINLEAWVFATNGLVLRGASTQILAAGWQEWNKANASQSKDVAIQYCEESKLLRQAVSQMGGEGNTITVDPAVQKILLEPETHEPLANIASDTLFAVGKYWNCDLVALVPDSLGLYACFDFEQKPSAAAFVDLLQRYRLAYAKTDGDWKTLIPFDSALERDSRVDRESLGRCLRTAKSKGLLELDDYAKFASENESSGSFSLALFSFVMLLGNAEMPMSFGEWDMLCLYGRLDQRQRQALFSGGKIPLSGLNRDQLRMVESMVYGADGRLDIEGMEAPADESEEPDMQMMLTSEPTEVLPNGFPPNSYLSLARAQEPMLSVRMMSDGQDIETRMGTEGIAWMVFASQVPELSSQGTQSVQEMGFRVGTQDNMTFKFAFSPTLSLSQQLTNARVPSEGSWLKYEALPEEIKKKILALVDQYKKDYEKNRAAGGDGESEPPPPPVR